MTSPSDDYRTFQEVHQNGLAQIQQAKNEALGNEQSKAVLAVVDRAWNALKGTAVGRQLYAHSDLEYELEGFERRLQRLATEFASASSPESAELKRWVEDKVDEGERRLAYYSEIARVLYYFRDRSEYLTYDRMKEHRKTIVEGSLAVRVAIDDLLSHVVSEVLFSRDDLQRLRRLAVETTKIASLSLRPGRGLDGLLPEDETFVRRQFIALVCQVALQIFGHVTREPLEAFLTLKTDHERRHNYVPWRADADDLADDAAQKLEASITKLLNRAIEKAYENAEKRAAKEGWRTLDLIRYTQDPAVRAGLYDRTSW